jgi:hypothetical protein
MKDVPKLNRIHISPDGRKWGQSQVFVTAYRSPQSPNAASLYPYYTALRTQVQQFINTEKIDEYEIVKTHDPINGRVSMQLFWKPNKVIGDR